MNKNKNRKSVLSGDIINSKVIKSSVMTEISKNILTEIRSSTDDNCLELLETLFILKPSYLKKGSEFLSNFLSCDEDLIRIALDKARKDKKLSNVKKIDTTDDIKFDYVSKESKNVNTQDEEIIFKTQQNFEPKSDSELAILHKVDLNRYVITNYWTKRLPNGKFTSSLFCKLKKNDILTLDHIREIFTLSPKRVFFNNKSSFIKGDKQLYSIDIPDLHVGKLAHAEESGSDYDSKIAVQKWNDSINSLLSRVSSNEYDRILLPIGNDMINIDNSSKTTTGGTPQDTDTRFQKMIVTVRDMLINTINDLSKFKQVDVLVVPGNHDQETMFTMGLILDAFFKNNDNVNIINNSFPRKYYQYGQNAFMYTHGNNENHKDLANIFANEQRELWGSTKYHYIKLGHFHKNKKTQIVVADEIQGCQIEILPSLSENDYWHAQKGYSSLRNATGNLYDHNLGLRAKYLA